ncbi:MAG: tyrosine-type recombinase/integrase [Clostridia bacterium]|nr:tyrosine-type recombinase/integrase [Clostridia bacterium]
MGVDYGSKSNRHITTRTAYNYKKAIEKAGRIKDLDARISTHTMRKTFGYHYYKMTKDIATLMGLFNHSAAATTLIYIGLASDEKKAAARKVNRMYD